MNKYTINIDWLELTLVGKLPEQFRKSPDSFEIAEMQFVHKKGGRTRHYNDMYEVFFFNNRVGHFLCNPHSEILNPDYIKFKFDNNILYENGWLDYLKLLIINTGWQINNITRLDLACDFRTFADDLHPQEFIKGFLTGQYMKFGRECSVSTYGMMNNVDTIKFGSGSSERTATLYNKSKELEKSGKLYIKAYHEKNLLPARNESETDVYRLEFRLSSKALKSLFNTQTTENFYDSLDSETGEIKATELEKFLDLKFLSSVYRNELESFMKFYDSRSVRGDLKMFEWVDVQKLPLQRFSTKNPSKTYKIKLLIKTLLSEYNAQPVTPGRNISHSDFHRAMQYMAMYDLDEFVTKRTKYWLKDWKPTRVAGQKYKNPIDYIQQRNAKCHHVESDWMANTAWFGNLLMQKAINEGKKNVEQYDYLKKQLKPCMYPAVYMQTLPNLSKVHGVAQR